VARRSFSLILILAITACTKSEPRPPNTDTVALLKTVVKYAADTLKVGPKVVIARATRANPGVRMSLATQNALVSADPALTAAERYDIVHQACDTVAKTPAFCHFAESDGLIAVRDVQLWRDSAHVAIEYYRTTPASHVKGKRTLVYDAGNASVARDVDGRWKMKRFTETGGTK
jgi:hypothetical protein